MPIAILISSIILGGFIYASQIIKQKSIEKQEVLKFIQSQEENCQKLAIQYKNNEPKDSQNTSYAHFEYHYNPNTKMCVLAYLKYSSFFSSRSQNITDYYVVDLFTNKEIYNKTGYENGEEAVKKFNEWKHIADLYFYQKMLREI